MGHQQEKEKKREDENTRRSLIVKGHKKDRDEQENKRS